MVYGTEKTKPEAVPALLAERKILFPILLDPERAYRNATGLKVYPTASLLDAGGRVVWEGLPFYRKRFADACEAEIERLLAGREDASR